jgi:hypothetical protein
MTKRRGRPPIDPNDVSVRLSVRLASKQYDAICARAGADRRTLPETIRRALADHLVQVRSVRHHRRER